MSRKPKISRPNFLVDLKEQYTTQLQNDEAFITYFAIIQIYKSSDSEVEKYCRDEQLAEIYV